MGSLWQNLPADHHVARLAGYSPATPSLPALEVLACCSAAQHRPCSLHTVGAVTHQELPAMHSSAAAPLHPVSALRLLLEVVHGEVGGEGGDGAEAVDERLHLALQPCAAQRAKGQQAYACTGQAWQQPWRLLALLLALPAGTQRRGLYATPVAPAGIDKQRPDRGVLGPPSNPHPPPTHSHTPTHLRSVGTSTTRLSRSMRNTSWAAPSSACCGRSTNCALNSLWWVGRGGAGARDVSGLGG